MPNIYIMLHKAGENTSHPVHGAKQNAGLYSANNTKLFQFDERASKEETYECIIAWIKPTGEEFFKLRKTLLFLCK